MKTDIDELLKKMKQFKQKLQNANSEVELELNKRFNVEYKLPSGEIFTYKMLSDLFMWRDLARDYGYDKLGIRQLREDLDELNRLRKQIK
jgi:hypothetical protein